MVPASSHVSAAPAGSARRERPTLRRTVCSTDAASLTERLQHRCQGSMRADHQPASSPSGSRTGDRRAQIESLNGHPWRGRAPDMTLKSGNPCAVVGFAVMFPVGARRPAGHSTGGGTPVSRRLQTRPVPLGVRRAARFCQSHLLRPKTSRRKEAHRRPSASPEVAAMFSTPCSRTMNPIDYSP